MKTGWQEMGGSCRRQARGSAGDRLGVSTIMLNSFSASRSLSGLMEPSKNANIIRFQLKGVYRIRFSWLHELRLPWQLMHVGVLLWLVG